MINITSIEEKNISITDREEALKALDDNIKYGYSPILNGHYETIRKALEAKEPEELRQEVEQLRDALILIRDAGQEITEVIAEKALAPQIGEK